MKHLLIAALLPCILATGYTETPYPILPVAPERIDLGLVLGPIYHVEDKDGVTHTGVVYGDKDYSVTVPLDTADKTVVVSGSTIIPLDR